jgi:uncharacterized YigZ family protein
MEDRFFTIGKAARAETKVKGSRFIAESFPAGSVEKAVNELETVRRREHAANHHCFAYRVGFGNEVSFRYSDDGEPNGTAGKPLYDTLCGADLTDTLLVVTRYFGGTKLGTGGLTRAYSEAAALVLTESGRRPEYLTERFRLRLDFAVYERWLQTLRQLEANVLKTDFAEAVSMTVAVRRSRTAQLTEAFIELTSGKGNIETLPAD